MSAPLKLFWWDGKPNFGDVISQTVTGYASGREVAWAKPKECEVFAIGSILQAARRVHKHPREDGSRAIVWGSGCMGPLRKDFTSNVDWAIVRGPITAALMGVQGDAFGDPGLLIAEAMNEDISFEDQIGLIPHHSLLEDPSYLELVRKNNALKLIDVRENALDVCREIARCRYVISSSLHGLIVADSFGVPNTWMDPAGIHQSPKMKFYDYAAGVERALPVPLALDEVAGFIKTLPESEITYTAGIERSKSALLAAFPAKLKAG